MLALRTNATIVPIGVSNTDRVWPKGSVAARGRGATRRCGSGSRSGSADVLPARPHDRKAAKGRHDALIMRRIAALLDPPSQRGAVRDEGRRRRRGDPFRGLGHERLDRDRPGRMR